jgi:membrane protein implicated in regulation of membrane protease activity
MPLHEMSLSAWRVRLVLYLVWVAAGASLAGVDSLDGNWKSTVKFSLGLVVAVVGAWRTFLDRSTPSETHPAAPAATTTTRKIP